MARRNIIEYSEDEDLHERATSPPASPVKRKGDAVASDESDAVDGSDNDDTASIADFIDDRALDELSEHSESAEEAFSDAENIDRTPPVTPLPKKQYPVDSDDENVNEAADFEPDVVESPKKRRSVGKGALVSAEPEDDSSDKMNISPPPRKSIPSTPSRKNQGTRMSADPEGDSSDNMNVSPTPKKSMPSTPSRKILVVHDSDSESIQEVENPKGTKKNAPAKETIAHNKSTPAQVKKPAAKKTPVSKKKAVKSKEFLSDTEDDAIMALKLDKDDRMYPERKPSKVQSTNLKRPLPNTPPLATRSSAKSATQHATPSKRQRRDSQAVQKEDEYEEVISQKSSKKPSGARGAKQLVANEEDQDVANDEEDKQTVTHVSPKKSGNARRAKKPIAVVEDDENHEGQEDDGSDDDNSGNVEPRPRAKAAPQKPTRAMRPKSTLSASNKQEASDGEQENIEAILNKKTSASTRASAAVTDETIDNDKTPKPSSRKVSVPARKPAPSTAPKSRRGRTVQDTDEEPEQDEEVAVAAVTGKPALANASKSRRSRAITDTDEELEEKITSSPKKVAGAARPKIDAESDPFNPPVSEKSRKVSASSSSTTKVKGEPEPVPTLFESRQPKRAPAAALRQTYSSKVWVALPPPETCEVYDVNLLDKALSSLKSYVGLDNLRFCDLVGTGQLFTGIETGRIRFSAWKDHLSPEMFKIVAALVAFQSDGRYINLSRISPSEIAARYMTETRHEITKDGRTAICIATGAVRESALVADLGTNYHYHALRIVLHSYEHERLAGILGEISRRPSLVTQIWNSAITFGTKNENTRTAKADLLPSGFYNSYQSPKKQRTVAASALPDHIGHLEYDDTIPVYDARNLEKGFEWTASIFANPARHFPLFPFSEFPEFNNEIPPNSLVTVGFVTQIYRMFDSAAAKDAKSKGKGKAKEEVEPAELRVNTMIRFVFVLAVIN